jgi:hypothetical protein
VSSTFRMLCRLTRRAVVAGRPRLGACIGPTTLIVVQLGSPGETARSFRSLAPPKVVA